MIRVCCAAGIIVVLDARDSTKRLAVMKSASENAATNDAHANWSPTPISATPNFVDCRKLESAGFVPKFGKNRQRRGGVPDGSRFATRHGGV
jgi:hypothetical protein